MTCEDQQDHESYRIVNMTQVLAMTMKVASITQLLQTPWKKSYAGRQHTRTTTLLQLSLDLSLAGIRRRMEAFPDSQAAPAHSALAARPGLYDNIATAVAGRYPTSHTHAQLGFHTCLTPIDRRLSAIIGAHRR